MKNWLLILLSMAFLPQAWGETKKSKSRFPAQQAVSVEILAKALEADMDKVKPDFSNPNTAAAQVQLADRSIDVLERLFREPMTPARLELVARLLVRSFEYDQSGDVITANLPAIKRNVRVLEPILERFEREGTFATESIRGVKQNIAISERVRKSGNDPSGK